MGVPAIPRMTYKYWLFKNKRKDSYEAFEDYYRHWVSESFFKAPNWLQDATIREAFKWRFINNWYF